MKWRTTIGAEPIHCPDSCKFVRLESGKDIFSSAIMTPKKGIPVWIVIVRNHSKKSEWLYLLSIGLQP